MRLKGALRRNEINEFITRLYDGDLHAKRVLSLANGTGVDLELTLKRLRK